MSPVDTFLTIARMSRAISALANIDNRDARAGAYVAANIAPEEVALLDHHAVIAEKARREAFPARAALMLAGES